MILLKGNKKDFLVLIKGNRNHLELIKDILL